MTSDSKNNDIEASSIPYELYRPKISKINCKHILVIIDACYSGSFIKEELMRGSNDTSYFKRPGELSQTEMFYHNYKQRISRLFLASGGLEKTPDNSKFAYFILEGLRKLNNKEMMFGVDLLYSTYINKANPVPLKGAFEKNEAGSNFFFFTKYQH